jgi:hypothetical protein
MNDNLRGLYNLWTGNSAKPQLKQLLAAIVELAGQPGPPGPPGPSGGDTSIFVPFSFADAFPLDLTVLTVGKVIIRCDVEIFTIFNDPASIAEVGTVAQPGVVLSHDKIDLLHIGQYNTLSFFSSNTIETLRLLVSPGNSTQGNGRVFLQFHG